MDEHKTDFDRIKAIAARDCAILEKKGATYGNSWKKRGGIGAFIVSARKWDRLETICEGYDYDIFEAGLQQDMDETVLDTLMDLRAYLLLIEEHIRWHLETKHMTDPVDNNTEAAATTGYVDQG